MKIVVYSSTYLPNVGGLENIMSGLVEQWGSLGHEIIVATKTPQNDNVDSNLSHATVRNPSWLSLYQLAKNSNIFIEANISLKTALIGLFFYRKWVVIHHLPYSHQNQLSGVVKNFLTFFCKNVAVSHFVAKNIIGRSTVIHNFFHHSFTNLKKKRNPNSLLFVGRLVSDKGVLLLLKAFKSIIKSNPNLRLTITGDGPDLKLFNDFVQNNILQSVVSFCGNKNRQELINLYNDNAIVIIPSTWEEPFGLVALEALACGCKVVYANGGGLPEATGAFGIPFIRANQASLENAIIAALEVGNTMPLKEDQITRHLANFNINMVSKKYLDYFNSLT